MHIYREHSRRSGKTAANDTDAPITPANDREGPLTPARYLTICREAAGLTRANVADRLQRLALADPEQLHPIGKRPVPGEARALVDLLESDFARARFRRTIAALAAIYPIDVDVYFQLRDEPADRHPTICRTCGCSPAGEICHGRETHRRAA